MTRCNGVPHDAVLRSGCGVGAARATKWRAARVGVPNGINYFAASVLEDYYGERRTHGPKGETQYWEWAPAKGEFDRRCDDPYLARAYS